MPAHNRTRKLATMASLAIVLALAAGGAIAAPKKPAPVVPDARPASAATASTAPARFFTLNDLIANGGADRSAASGRVAAVERTNTATDAAAPTIASGPEPFGLYTFRAPDGAVWKKWRALEADLAAEAKAPAGTPEAARFVAIVEETKSRDGRARLETVNRLINGALRYVTDYEQHGVADRWTAPLAALAAGKGDCEEYAVAKYTVLRAAGVEESDMRLVLVRDTQIRIDHAVLAVRFEARWLVLDNRKSSVVETADVRHYQPLYAVGGDGVKLFAAPYAGWGEGGGEFANWSLRGSDGAEFAEWTLRGIDGGALNAEPAANF